MTGGDGFTISACIQKKADAGPMKIEKAWGVWTDGSERVETGRNETESGKNKSRTREKRFRKDRV